ncbi:adenylate cyclase [Paenibacillus athensensis]|uniref:Adenylate cyclase n=1 Tax=Paenibacillus athensensis TaxID=1967502 RepID=A0A4Y8Q6A8_9BACL|nr:adenylate cyclase [Paenibacillus athensensis]
MREQLTVLYHFMLTRSRHWSGRSELEHWQEARIRTHIERVRSASPFYRELWAGRPAAEWRTFPTIAKAEMMAHFDALNTVGLRREEAWAAAVEAERTRGTAPEQRGCAVGLSSGTSGSRGLFVVSRKERLAWAGTVLAKVLPGSLVQAHRIAFFLRANNELYGSVGSRRIAFDFYDLLQPFSDHIRRLNEQAPTLLVAPPSVLRLLAAALRRGALRIGPRKIVAVAEALDPLDREEIEAAFGQLLHQVYQCTEGFLAATCAEGRLHINEDIVHIQQEPLDAAARKFVPIVTDFSRLAQPIVRYRLNDVLTAAAAPCRCGSPLAALDAVEGRCDDMWYVPAGSGAGLVRLFADYISRAIIGACANLEAYRAIQHAPERIEIELAAPPGQLAAAESAVRQALAALCARVGGRLPAELTFAAYRPPGGDRKLRRVERRFAVDESRDAIVE